MSAFWKWFAANQWNMFAMFVISGSVVCFFGRTFFKSVIFMTGVILAVVLAWLVFYSTVLLNNSSIWLGWLIFLVFVFLGFGFGSFLISVQKLGPFIVASWGGYCLALLLYDAFVYKLNSNVVFWIFSVLLAIISGCLTFYVFDHVLIHSTAMLGSYLAIYGIGLISDDY